MYSLQPCIDCELQGGKDFMLCYSFCNPVVLGTEEAHNKYLLNFIEPAHRLLTLISGSDPCLKY